MDWSQFLASVACLIPVAIGIYGINKTIQEAEQNYQAYQGQKQLMGNDEEERKTKTAMAWYGYIGLINHDGNPRNDTYTSQYTPGKDAWKSKHH